MKKPRKQSSLAAQSKDAQATQIMTLAYKFAAMRLPSRERVDAVFEGARVMPDATAWDEAVDEGRVQTGRRALLIQGRQLFGEPSARSEKTLIAIDDPDRLERMLEAILSLKSWKG